MPIRITSTAAPAGTSYIDIRAGGAHSIHQRKLDVSTLSGLVDANGTLPPGTVLKISAGVGIPVAGTTDEVEIIGPDPVKIGADTTDIFGNVFRSGDFNRDAIEDNIGRALSSNELASIRAWNSFRLLES